MFITEVHLFVADETFYADDDLNKWKVASGLETVMPNTAGVYHYKTTSHAYHINTCSLVVQGGARNHTIHVTDTGFEPKVLTAHAGDRIWWVWQEGEKEHNILQVCDVTTFSTNTTSKSFSKFSRTFLSQLTALRTQGLALAVG